jgi:hypothetical protein
MAERGLRTLDRRSHIAAIAAALEVSEADLVGGPHLSRDPVQADPHSVIPALRMVLETNTLTSPCCEQARPLPELVSEVHALEPLFFACDYVTLGKRLPPVIDELHLHIADPEDETAQRIALENLIEACMYATFRSKDLGYTDLAHVAASRANEAAAYLDDPIQKGKAAYLRVQTMPREHSWSRVLITAEKEADRLQPHAQDKAGIEVLGMLTLSSSLAAASLHKSETAEHWLNEAQRLAERVPDTPKANWSSFSATNVGVWRVAIAVENGHTGGSVLSLADQVDRTKLKERTSRHAAFLADVGRSLARDPKLSREAVRWLRDAERIAPQRIRNSAPVREAVSVMLEQARVSATGPELRGMAARMGVPH